VRGLHFLGAPAVHSFGALVRFVSGTDFAARALDRSIAADLDRPASRDRPDRSIFVGSPDRRLR
jgi:hypothetical protein